ncbi:MAG: Arsenite methyltransferase [Anaerolineales bacterium]|nr:Arsenite methyltransferase [Anaerolineales bacterium]
MSNQNNSPTKVANPAGADSTRTSVQNHYATQARAASATGSSCCGPSAGSCCDTETIAEEDLTAVVEGDTPPSWGCGNPTALVALKPGQVVLDLGSGAGFDAFLAAQRVAPSGGPKGRVIGVDMTGEMLELARSHAQRLGLADVTEFRRGYIEGLPVEDESVDVILSNCVINLAPDKDAVFREAYRVLKPGGWLAISDIVTSGPLPASVREDTELWGMCISGALEESEYLAKVRAAGFKSIEVNKREPSTPLPDVRIISLTFRAFKSSSR